MEYIKIATLFPRVSRIGLGTWAMGGSLWGASNEQDSIDTILYALGQGINFIDTAPGYGFGQSEEVIGKALKQYGTGKRDHIILATKFGLNLNDQMHVFRDSRPTSIRAEIEKSLRLLQVDYIDLYQVHWPDHLTPQAEIAQVLLELIQEGKIRAIGVCNYSLKELGEFLAVAPIHAIQHPFNIFEREAEADILPFCKQHEICSLGYSSLCRGLLTGALKDDQEFEELRKNFDPKFKRPHFPQYLVCVGRLQQWVADKYQRSLVALAVRWSLDKGADVALWGARQPRELGVLDEILGWHLMAEDFAEIDAIIAETITDPIGPQFMAPPFRTL